MTSEPTAKDTLRRVAETRATRAPVLTRPTDPERLLHELRVHQIELEMQNDQLRQTQIALEKSRDRYVSLYEFSPVGYLTLSATGLVVHANLTSAALLGIERSKLRPHRFSRFIAPDDCDRFQRLFREVARHDERQICELRLQRDDGSIFHARLDLMRIDAGDDAAEVRVALTDISEHVQAEERRLAHARQQRDTLVLEVHHRIKNHLQGLVGMLHQHIQQQPELASSLHRVASQIDTLAVVHGLQARLADGNPQLGDLIAEIAAFLRKLQQATLEISHEPGSAPHAWQVAAEESVPLALILNEMMVNAIRHGRSAQDGQPANIRIRHTSDERGAAVIIENTGSLPAGFDFAERKGLGTGLSLIRSLLPPADARFAITARDGRVETRLELTPPVLVALAN